MLSETKTATSKFPRQTHWHSVSVPLNNLGWSHFVVTCHSRTSCSMYRTAHLLSESQCLACFTPRLCVFGGGWEVLSAITEQNDLRLFFHSIWQIVPKQCRQASMSTVIEEHAAVVFFLVYFVYPGSHSRYECVHVHVWMGWGWV